MRCLVIIAHPDSGSLCHSLAHVAIQTLTEAGHEVVIDDLYQSGFIPSLTISERKTYYDPPFDSSAMESRMESLRSTEALVLVFPVWWFGFPAILKGWFDRVWAPGIAYDHATDLGPIKPRLHNLRLWQPVKRVLKTAILRTCAPECRFEILSLYKAEHLTVREVDVFSLRIHKKLGKWQI